MKPVVVSAGATASADIEQSTDEDQRDCADDRGKAASAVEVLASATGKKARQQRATDAKQDRRYPAHVDRAGIKEPRQRTDDEAADDGADDVEHGFATLVLLGFRVLDAR